MGHLADTLADDVSKELLAASAPAAGSHSGASGIVRLAGEVEQHGRDVDAGDAVDQRVVRLLDHRDVAALEPLDEPQLPERAAPVEQLGLHALEQREQLRADRASAAR